MHRPISNVMAVLRTFTAATTLLASAALADVIQTTHFTNPLYRGADPWIAQKDSHYYLCQSTGHGILVYSSTKLTDRGQGKLVWHAPKSGWNCAQVWAPELHYLRGRWYIYYAASTGQNFTHRMGVLESATDDPQGPYIDKGMLYTGDDIARKSAHRWAIDGTILNLRDKLYLIWSGWPDQRDLQHLYIARMENPWTIASDRVRLCDNDTYPWERLRDDPHQRGLNEGPVVLLRNNRIFLFYSCSGSWQPTYKLGLLIADAAADPMDPASWRKLDHPVFSSTPHVPGVGHCSFATSPDGTQDWIVYHAKLGVEDGWARDVRMQSFGWGKDGLPDLGQPAAPGQWLPKPAGE